MQEISGSQLIGLGPSCALIGTVTFNECASIAAWLEQNKVRYISMPFLLNEARIFFCDAITGQKKNSLACFLFQ